MTRETDSERWEVVKAIVKGDRLPDLELGAYWRHMLVVDAKHAIFALSRYKFACKMLARRKELTVLELGCNEAWGALMLQQGTDLKGYVGVDLDGEAIAWNEKNLHTDAFEFHEANFLEDMKLDGQFDAVISLDVIEHIEPTMERRFCQVIVDHLKSSGVAIIGTPNVTMSPYAGPESRAGHINLYDQDRLYDLLDGFFENVFIFGMNDEVVHTGFAPMSCYIFAVCAGKRG